MKYISKFEYGNTIGYQVRVPEFKGIAFVGNNHDHNHSRFFARSKYQSWGACKMAAKIYRDQYLKEHDAMDFLKVKAAKHRPMKHSKRNTSGIIGVVYAVEMKESGTYYAYKALFSANKVQRTKQFATSIYGEVESFLKACRVRYQKEGILVILDDTLIPCWPDVPYVVDNS